MEKSSSPSKLLLLLLLQLLLLSKLLEARILGDRYDCKHLLASDVDGDDAVLSSSNLNLADDALDRPSKYTPPSPKPGPSPHPVLGCRPPHLRYSGDSVLVLQQRSPPSSSPTGPAPPRDYRRQQAEAA
ncbi:uncharacterized protein [Lolium perenne]|uniref:uncharacterized protein n=1 Tax=Lolium perenne TaxID=4522 RepID=UPI0021F50C37|nr:uncharacterized protein LOC127326479 [Lolium perenne]